VAVVASIYIPPISSKHAPSNYDKVLDDLFETVLLLKSKYIANVEAVMLAGDFNAHTGKLQGMLD
jgi:hypothetical protein